MTERLKILLLEDSAEDAEIVQRVLKKENLNCEFQVVMTKEGYVNSLNNFQPDLILSDNSLPQFNATEALNIIRQQSIHIPFILVTGTVSEEFAAKIIKAGATDYILKDRMARLPTAIDAALKQKKIEKEKLEAEKKVRESEEEYRTLVEQAADGIFIADMQGKFIAVNSSGCMMSQYSEEELLKMTIFDLAIPEDIQRNPFHIDEMRQGKTVVVERVMRRKDGKVVDVETTGKILKDGRMLVFVRDITDRKKAAEALSSNELRFRTLTGNAPVGIFQSDAAGKTTYVNETWLEYTGLSVGEAMGDGWIKALHPEDKEIQLKQWRDKSKEGQESFSEFRLIDKKGNTRWVVGKATPLFNINGQIAGYIGTLSDITKNKNAEEALRRSEERLKQAQAIAHVGNWEVNFETNVSVWSDEAYKIYGLLPKAHKLSIEDWMLFIHPDDLDFVKKEIKKSQVSLNDSSFYHRIIRKDGAIRYVLSESRYEFNNEGKPIGLYGIVHDVTEIKKAENEIRLMNEQLRLLSEHQQNIREEERTHIAREIHDELGQQLTVMKMDVSWLNKKLGAIDETVGKKTLELSKILDETVKTVRRIASELRPSLLDDLGLVAAIEWQLNEFEKRSGIKAELKKMRIEPLLPDAARTGLFRIVQESLTNVARHANAKKVTISLQQKKGLLVLKIEDDGIGFDKEKITGKKTLGILGMKERTSVMGGTYEIESASGKGTIVSVTVPFSE